MEKLVWLVILLWTSVLADGCEAGGKSYSDQQAAVDAAFARVAQAVDRAPGLRPFLKVDHRRRGQKAGQSMPPATVGLFRAPELEIAAVRHNPKAAMEFPLRVLVYADPDGGVHMAYNSLDFVRSRHDLAGALEGMAYKQILKDLAEAAGIPAHATALPKDGTHGLIVNHADGSVPEVAARLRQAVEEVEGAVYFGEIDYQAEAKEFGKDIPPVTLVVFGNPALGVPAMADLPDLGLDQFPQKVVIWEDDDGVHTAHNDIGWQTDRRGGRRSLARARVRSGVGSTVRGAANP